MEILIIWSILSICVAILAERRGRSGVGFFFLALLISPLIAGIVVLCLTDLRTTKEQAKRDYMMQMQIRSQQQQLEELRRLQSPSQPTKSHLLPPPGARETIHIARGGERLGSFTVAETKRMLEDGRLSLEDFYFDDSCNEWIELAGHPILNPI